MGGNWSSLEREPSPDPWWPAPQLDSDTQATDQDVQKNEAADTINELKEERQPKGQVKQKELDKFKEELAQKRALRNEALGALQAELLNLRRRVAQTDEITRELEEQQKENQKLVLEKERLLEQMEHKAALEKQVQSLKDVAEIGKEMLRIRELQVKELKKKLLEINISSVTSPPEDLRIEYEKQIENIRKLRTLYEERAAATLLEHRRQLEREEARITVLEAKLSELQKETNECKEAKKDLEGKIEKLEITIQTKEDELDSTKDKLFSTTIQNKSLNSQIKLINNLFSQMLVSPNVDLDQLIRLLKENHGLITDLTENGDVNEVASLLVDLASQIEKEKIEKIKSEETLSCDTTEQSVEVYEHGDGSENSQLKIASNLSKVWKIMIELLSHHQNSGETEISGGAESCYKSIQTPSGPRSVISVSQTFITLKDLILEKNKLVKEVGRLKTLNCHLEHRLGSQEKRLLVVTSELRKTWGVVNKLKAQHKQLHTHEKILRYELQQKRCMLNELKLELDHCRDKWEQARQKNSQTEEDWKKLRKEFAARKSRKESNSAESGFEEDDVAQSPPCETIRSGECLFVIKKNESGEAELSEEDIEHSDGNSFDTVIDLLDITCINNQTENEIPFVLNEEPPETQEFSPPLLPLSGSEFTEGLDQIESEDLAAVLDVQYQTQLLVADYNLSLPSSSGSSPIPTENDDFALSEMDVSEEDSSTNDNHIYTTPLPVANQNISEDKLLFGSNSSTNISKFLEGLFTEHENSRNQTDTQQNLHIAIPSTSVGDENGSTTPIVNNENCYEFSSNSFSQGVSEDNLKKIYPSDVNGDNEINLKPNIEQQGYCRSGLSTSTPSLMESKNMNDSSSNSISSENRTAMEEESLRSREERLKKLEKQCRSLVTKVMSTSFRSEVLSNKRDELQQCHNLSEDQSSAEEATPDLNSVQTLVQLSEENQSIGFLCKEGSSSKVPDTITSTNENSGISKDTNISELKNNQESLPQQTNSEETLELRAERVKKLEDQCKTLFTKMSASSRNKNTSLKMDQQHDPATSFNSTLPLVSHSPKTDSSKPANNTSRSPNDPRINNESKLNIRRNTVENPLDLHDLDSESKAILSKFSGSGPQLEPATVSYDDSKKNRTPEQILEARAERFKRLEEQCKSLVSKMTATSLRSEIISNKLDELHSCYGSTESASGSDEPSSLEDRIRPSPSSSPKNNQRVACSLEFENPKKEPNVQKGEETGQSNQEERVNFTPEEPQSQLNSTTDRSKKTPEEILQARAQRLNRLEEQCKSLFSKMSATSQRSDVISNKLEELHEQYSQPSTSQNREYRNNPSKTVATNSTTESETSSGRKSSQSDTLNRKERSRSPSTSSEK